MFMNQIKVAATAFLVVAVLVTGVFGFVQRSGPPGIGGSRDAAPVTPEPPAAAQPQKTEQPNRDLAPTPPATLSNEQVKALLNRNASGEQMKSLLAQRLQAADEEARAAWAGVTAGIQGYTMKIFMDSSLHLLEAERELSDDKAHQIVALENHLQRHARGREGGTGHVRSGPVRTHRFASYQRFGSIGSRRRSGWSGPKVNDRLNGATQGQQETPRFLAGFLQCPL